MVTERSRKLSEHNLYFYFVKKMIVFSLLVYFSFLFGCMRANGNNAFSYDELVEENVSVEEFIERFFSMENKKDYVCDLPIFTENNGDCGYVQVPKDYSDASKGYYDIFWYVFKSTAQEGGIAEQFYGKSNHDPIIFLSGGPGLSGSMRVDAILGTGISQFRDNHDIYGIDYRTCGFSFPYTNDNFMNCEYIDWMGDRDASSANNIKTCSEYLQSEENKNLYVGIDVETVSRDIIRFLEIKNIDKAILYGQSAGTTVALVSSKISPERISGMVLDGPVSIEIGKENSKSDALLYGIYNFLKAYEENKHLMPTDLDFENRIISLVEHTNQENKDFAYQILTAISKFSQDKYRFVIADKLIETFKNDDREHFHEITGMLSQNYDIDYLDFFHGSLYEQQLFIYHAQGIYFFNRFFGRSLTYDETLSWENRGNLNEKIADFIYEYEGSEVIKGTTELIKGMNFDFKPYEEKYKTENIDVPTLILTGSRDIQTPTPWAEFIHSKLNNSNLFNLQNGVHVSTRINDCSVRLMGKFISDPENVENIDDICVTEINDYHNEISYDENKFDGLIGLSN